MASNLQLSGLASGFDWKSLVDQLMEVERAPITRLETEKTRNNSKVSALANLATRLTALEASATALGADGAFGLRTATVAGAAGWTASASPATAAGAYRIAVSQLATSARREGAVNIGSGLSATADVSGATLASLPVGQPVTAGTFTVNGQAVTVSLTDSLASVFTAISTATNGEVTAAYDPATDRITLSGTGEIVLGAANDTSNFLRALKLGNNGTATVTSSGQLGTVKTGATLASANLGAAITAVDGAGAGSFQINGVTFNYNVNTDTLAGLITQINQSSAGVTATYDPTQDRMLLTNDTTGDLGVAVSEASGGLLGALGLTTGGALVRGQDALFSINGGATLRSASNTLDETTLGVPGLSVTAATTTTETVTVAADTQSMRAKLDDFISKFNDLQDYLETATKITTDSKGKVTAAILADNREVQEWGRTMRQMAFAAVGGATGSIARLESLGIDFVAGTNKLEVKDGAKLDAALRDKPTEVDAFFHSATTGFAAKFKNFLGTVTGLNTTQQKNLNQSNTRLDTQIADLERRLTQQRAILESAFIAMESAQQKLQTQQAALANAFSTSSS